MSTDSSQLLLLGNQPTKHSVEVEEALARGCKSRHHALVKCYEVSNLEPKEVYLVLGIDQSTFSRIVSGKAFPDPELYFGWMEVCGNHIPLRYDAWRTGYELRPVITGLEAELAKEREKRLEAERRQRYLEELLIGRRA